MFKFAIKVLLIISLLPLFSTQATLITDTSQLTDDHYVTYEGIDFAWVSPVNVEFWPGTNILYAPDLHDGWDFATSEELALFRSNFSLSDFRFEISPGIYRYKHAVQFWNSFFTDVRICSDVDDSCEEQNVQNLIDGEIRSSWTTDSNIEILPGLFFTIDAIDMESAHFETIYIRRNAQPVPEPATLLIFALGIFALALRVRITK